MYKGRQIVIHQASWSFREKIWVDDELVVNEIGARLASNHVLDVGGDKLLVTFGYRRGMKEIFVEAKADDEVVYELTHELSANVKPWSVAIVSILSGLAGLALGYLVGSLIGGA
jgi:hypothetical protein